MIATIEQINEAGYAFVEFALPMLIQSGFLVVILLLADLLLRKKVRAVFRYWIWMLVLVKLLLPTSLSSPVSVGRWFGDELAYVDVTPAPAAEPKVDIAPTPVAEAPPVIDIRRVETTTRTPAVAAVEPTARPLEPAAAEPISPLSSPASPATPLSWQGAAFLSWLAVLMAMALLLLQRALFVRRLVAQAGKANRPMTEVLGHCCQRMAVKRRIDLRISASATSPAVCGLSNPVILVPKNLAPGLSSGELRVVLLHELAHIKRGDLWVNLAQTILQIFYFYNPLLWLAGAMIRRVREQAVNEMVLVAMGEKARQYPQTLVNVAKMAFKRPALSLRLIGVVESKSALTCRIKHILSRPMPKTAKLGIIGLVVVIVAAAILLPMAAFMPGSPELVIKGVVKDAQTGKPIAGARVFDDGYGPTPSWDQIRADERSEWGAITNSAGEYNFLTWPEHHSISVEAPGYESKRESLYDGHFILKKKDEEIINFALEPEDISGSSEFKKTLPNGVTVELLGICQHPSEGKQWWRPDGTWLQLAPYDEIGGKVYTSGKKQAYEFAVRLHNLPQDSDNTKMTKLKIDGRSAGGGAEPRKDGKRLSDVRWMATALPEDQQTCTVQVGISAGAWNTVATHLGKGGQHLGLPGSNSVHFSEAMTVQNRVKMVVSDTFLNHPHRVIAVDIAGRIHKPNDIGSGTSGNIRQTTFGFDDLPVNRIRDFRFQTRPYERLEFKNVSLKPNFKNDVQVELGNTATINWVVEDYGQTRLLSDKEIPDTDNWVSIWASAVKNKGRYLVPDRGLTLKGLIKAAGYNRDKLAESYVELIRRSQQGNITARSTYSRNLKTLLSGKESDIVMKPNDAVVGGYIEPSTNGVEFWSGYHFSEVVELTVNDDGEKINMFADLDAGKLVTPPDTLNNNDENAVLRWIKENGIDVMGETASSVHGLIDFNMYAARVDNYLWDAGPLEFTDRLMVRIDDPVLLSVENLLPVTYLTKTSEYKMGILQILGFVENPKGIKIRYKLLNKEAAPKPDVRTAPEPASGNWQYISQSIPPDFNDTMILAENANLGSIGHDAEGKTFITFVRDREEAQNRQYRFVLFNKAGNILEPDGHIVLGESKRLEEKFTFDEPFITRRLKGFRFQARPLPPSGFDNISSILQKVASEEIKDEEISPSSLAPPGRYAIELDGVDDYLLVPDSLSLRLEPPFTIEMWVKAKLPPDASEYRGGWAVISKGFTVGTPRAYLTGFGINLGRRPNEPSQLYIDFCKSNNSGTYAATYAGYPLTNGVSEWIHITHIFKGEHYKSTPGHPLVMGKFLIPTENPFKGLLGEVRLWNGARTRQELRQYKDVALTGTEPGLAACWTFEQTEGRYAYDISGNNNHARLGKSTGPDDADPKWVDLAQSEERLFNVYGTVVDQSGRPIAGVDLTADCGHGKLERTGRAVTDENGRYELSLTSSVKNLGADPYDVGIQTARIEACAKGFYEANICRDGNLAMAGKPPGPDEQRFVADYAGVVLPYDPYELNFVMHPAARIEGELVNERGKPIPRLLLWLQGDDLYLSNTVDIAGMSDRSGKFTINDIPCKSIRFVCHRVKVLESGMVALTTPGTYQIKLQFAESASGEPSLTIAEFRPPARGGPAESVRSQPATKQNAVSGSPQPRDISPPILGYDVKLNFADPTARDGSFHGDQSVAFIMSFHRIEGLQTDTLFGRLLVGQTTWPVLVADDSVTIQEGSAGKTIRTESWLARQRQFDRVIRLPLKYGQKTYACPVHVEMMRAEEGKPIGSYWFCAYLSGRLPWGAGGRTFEIVNLDQQMEFRLTGDGTDKRDAVLGIDINGDGKIDPTETGGEQFGLYELFKIGSKTYRVREVDPYSPCVVFLEVKPGQLAGPAPKIDAQAKVEPASGGDDEIFGRVVDRKGEPVTGAQVALSTAKIGVQISDGKLKPIHSNESRIVQTDADGRFVSGQRPAGSFILVVAHDKGFAFVRSEEITDSHEIQLQPWGRIEGRVVSGRKARGGKIWMSGLPNSTWFLHKRECRYETACDADGRFAFEKVPAGWFEAGYLIRTGDSGWSITSRTPVKVEAGETAEITLGGSGRPVVGKFVPPEGYDKPIYFGNGLRSLATVRPERPRPDNYDQMTKRQQQQWYRQWRKTDGYKEYRDAVWLDKNWRQYTFRIKKDGSFRIEDVIAGEYEFTVWIEERMSSQGRPEEIATYSGTIEVPQMPGGRSDEPLDLGELELTMNDPLRVGDVAPLFEAKTLDGRDLKLSDYRGKFVLLSFWQPAFHPEIERLKILSAGYNAAGRLEIIGLGGQDTLEEIRKYVQENDIPWPQIFTGEEFKSGIAEDYRIPGMPWIFLIGPDGRIAATNLRAEKLSSTVLEALETPSPSRTETSAETKAPQPPFFRDKVTDVRLPFTFTIYTLTPDNKPQPGVKVRCLHPRPEQAGPIVDMVVESDENGVAEFTITQADLLTDWMYWFSLDDEEKNTRRTRKGGSRFGFLRLTL